MNVIPTQSLHIIHGKKKNTYNLNPHASSLIFLVYLLYEKMRASYSFALSDLGAVHSRMGDMPQVHIFCEFPQNWEILHSMALNPI